MSLEYNRMSQIMSQTNRQRKFHGANVPGSEYSWERHVGARKPGSERARERIDGQDPIGRFAPGSELARERKGCESADARLLTRTHIFDAELMRYSSSV